jgi:hypothetical protein
MTDYMRALIARLQRLLGIRNADLEFDLVPGVRVKGRQKQEIEVRSQALSSRLLYLFSRRAAHTR